MKKLLLILATVLASTNVNAQAVKKFFKFSTFYGVGSLEQPFTTNNRTWFVEQDGNVIDVTPEMQPNYNYGFGIRKVARFDYERKPGVFYDGNEQQIGFNTTIGAVRGWEYKFEYTWARQFNNEFNNKDLFLRYLAKNWVFKLESYDNGFVGLDYDAADLRWRKPIGKKLNLTVGLVGRTHRPYGYNPIEDYLEEKAWWDLAYQYGYSDNSFGMDLDLDGEIDVYDFYWTNPNGERVADTDLMFRQQIFGSIVNDYNNSILSEINDLATISGVIGLDFYHYSKDNWVHAWGSILPVHDQILGDDDFSYRLWNDDQNWIDYNFGLVTGWQISNQLGIFIEGNFVKYWDREVYSAKAGLNYQFK